MQEEGLDTVVLNRLQLDPHSTTQLEEWKQFLEVLDQPKHQLRIGLVGKYVELQDAYKSILEALLHAGVANEAAVEVVPIHSEALDHALENDLFTALDGVLVAPGFGIGVPKENKRHSVRTRKQYSLLWNLLRNANGCGRIRQKRKRTYHCKFHRNR